MGGRQEPKAEDAASKERAREEVRKTPEFKQADRERAAHEREARRHEAKEDDLAEKAAESEQEAEELRERARVEAVAAGEHLTHAASTGVSHQDRAAALAAKGKALELVAVQNLQRNGALVPAGTELQFEPTEWEHVVDLLNSRAVAWPESAERELKAAAEAQHAAENAPAYFWA